MNGIVHVALLIAISLFWLAFYLVGFLIFVIGMGAVGQLFRDRFRRPTPTEEMRRAAARLVGRLKRLARPTLLLVPAKEPGFSKLGGDPELAADLEWPVDDDSPRTFVAQIDLAVFQPHIELGWLPPEGRIYAFYDPKRHGCADVVRILYSQLPPEPPAAAPIGMRLRFPERRVAFMVFKSIPSFDWLGMNDEAFSDAPEDWLNAEEFADAPPPDELQHRIGGYPDEIQTECMPLVCEHLARDLPPPIWGADVPAAIARASKEWRLLLQIDSDPALKMNWGDGGRLYVFIRERHARAGDFSKTVSLWQTY